MGIEPGRLLGLAEEMATRAREEDAGQAALAVLAAHAALEATPDLERLQALRDAVVGFRGAPERLDRRSTSPPPEAPRAVGAEEARWAVELARRVVAEFHRAAGRDAPGWV